MAERPKGQPNPQLPPDALAQLSRLPTPDRQEEILKQLFGNVTELLQAHQIPIDHQLSTARVKTTASIDRKLRRRGDEKLILDIYGLQLIVDPQHIYPTVEVIASHYPTPEYFPQGVPSRRDYNDPTIPWNPLRQPDYHAVHQNIVFMNGEDVGIAEIKVMTKEQLEAANKNRSAYEELREAAEIAEEVTKQLENEGFN